MTQDEMRFYLTACREHFLELQKMTLDPMNTALAGIRLCDQALASLKPDLKVVRSSSAPNGTLDP